MVHGIHQQPHEPWFDLTVYGWQKFQRNILSEHTIRNNNDFLPSIWYNDTPQTPSIIIRRKIQLICICKLFRGGGRERRYAHHMHNGIKQCFASVLNDSLTGLKCKTNAKLFKCRCQHICTATRLATDTGRHGLLILANSKSQVKICNACSMCNQTMTIFITALCNTFSN